MIGTLPFTLGRIVDMTEPSPAGGPPNASGEDVPVEADTSFSLIRRAQSGDDAARNELCARYLPHPACKLEAMPRFCCAT